MDSRHIVESRDNKNKQTNKRQQQKNTAMGRNNL